MGGRRGTAKEKRKERKRGELKEEELKVGETVEEIESRKGCLLLSLWVTKQVERN